jgi:SWI/SNF-related matrix-associated actin-dependent regulator 1 of chromatin subfamily A
MCPTRPFKFQVEGVRILRGHGGVDLVADDPGLGKTIQVLLWLRYYYKLKCPIVVICPATAKEGWRRQAIQHVGMRAVVLGKKRPPKGFKLEPGVIYIINYDVLGNPKFRRGTWFRKLRAARPGAVIWDENQAVKNFKAARTKATTQLAKRAPHRIAMGGTAGLELTPADLFPTLNALWPKEFPSFWSFAFAHCKPRRNPWTGGWEFKGASNVKKLHRKLRRLGMIRRLKKDVLKDLPPKLFVPVPLEIERPAEYREAETDTVRWLVKQSKRKAFAAKSAPALARIGVTKKLAAELKLKAVISWVRDYLEGTGKKLVLFGWHTDLIAKVAEAFSKSCVVITGKTPQHKRQGLIDRFNKEPSCRLLVGNIEAAGTAWSCTATSAVAFFELAWNPAKHRQAEDRVHGVGRGVAGEHPTVYYLIAAGTVEERIMKLLEERQRVNDRVLDGREGAEGNLVTELLEQMTKGGYSWQLAV